MTNWKLDRMNDVSELNNKIEAMSEKFYSEDMSDDDDKIWNDLLLIQSILSNAHSAISNLNKAVNI